MTLDIGAKHEELYPKPQDYDVTVIHSESQPEEPDDDEPGPEDEPEDEPDEGGEG